MPGCSTPRRALPELGYGSAINTFCAVIPFIFYAIAAVALVPLFSLGLVPKLGRMKKAYRRVEETGKVYSPESAELNLEDEDDSPAITGCLWDFVLPIGTLIAFLVVAALNFTTGSVWGITAVTVPILLPLAFSIGANPLLVMGAIVSGATLGSHACFYSDATVLTSSCCKMENMDHALSQLPYSLCAAGLSAAGYLVCGLLM